MEKIDNYIPVTKAKSQMLDIIRDIGTYDNVIAITKNGLPSAVMMSMEHYNALQETIEILADSDIMGQIRGSVKELQSADQLVDLKDL